MNDRWDQSECLPDRIPRCCGHPSFDRLASPPRYPDYRSLMDSKRWPEDRQEQIGLGVEADIGRCNHPPM
jgi:hypothetical protein